MPVRQSSIQASMNLIDEVEGTGLIEAIIAVNKNLGAIGEVAEIDLEDLDAKAEVIANAMSDVADFLVDGEQARDDAEAAWLSFDKRYLGDKTVAPTVDNTGATLQNGALYWNSLNDQLYVWEESVWNPASFSNGDVVLLNEAQTLTNKTIDGITNKVGADHVHYVVRNNTGVDIVKGTIVAATGTQPGTDYVTVEPVTSSSQVAIGMTAEVMVNNAVGLVVNTGVVANLDTSAWSEGTILYVGTSGFTNVKPTVGMYQASAVVTRSHSSEGTVLVEFSEPTFIASTSQAGNVQLNDTLTSISTTQALTAKQGKAVNDRLAAAENKLVGIEAGATADQTKAEIDALGINAATVNSKTVETDVPVGAVFTDTVYDDTDVVTSISALEIRTFEPTVKPTLKFDFARNEAIIYDGAENSFVSKSVTQAVTDGDLVVTNGASNVYDARGRLAPVSFDRARLTFNPKTGESEGLLNEMASNNYLLYSEDFTQAEWAKSNATSIEATGNTETVFGNLEIQELFGANDTAKTSRFQSYTVADDDNSYTGSVYIKRGDTDYGVFQLGLLGGTTEVAEFIYVDFTNPDIVTSGNGKLVDSDDQGGYRIEFSITNNSTGNTTLRYYVREPSSIPNSIGLNSDTLTIYAGGFMLESGLAATSYIKTTDISINRVSDSVELNDIAQYLDFNRGFSIYFEMGGESASNAQQVLFNCNLDSIAFTFRLAVSDDNQSFNFYLRNNPSRLDFPKPNDGEFHKYLISFDGVNFNAYVDGIKVRSVAYVDPEVTTTSFGTFFLGSIGGNTSLTTKFKSLEVTPKGLTDAEGIAITGGAN